MTDSMITLVVMGLLGTIVFLLTKKILTLIITTTRAIAIIKIITGIPGGLIWNIM